MTQVTFQLRQRPSPIHTQSSGSPVTRCEKSPYPRCSSPESPPESPASMIDAEQRTYYLHEVPRPEAFVTTISNFFKSEFPNTECSVKWTCSFFTVDENWELVRPGPAQESASSKLVHAHRLYVEFYVGGPEIPALDGVEAYIRGLCRDEHDMPDIVIEFALLGKDRPVFAWYPPTPDKRKLREFFEQHGPGDSVEEKRDGTSRL
ncbi:hypothetical protein F5B21DRAFT_240601 [Xylaria acuta]|nr:hypothetical protein F5B21DRAFT_240601 [Xylaria acuta]